MHTAIERKEIRVPIRSRFKLLLAEREIREGRKISLKEIAEETGLSTNSLSGLSTQSTQRFDADVIDRVCEYFTREGFYCDVGDLLTRIPNGDREIKKAG